MIYQQSTLIEAFHVAVVFILDTMRHSGVLGDTDLDLDLWLDLKAFIYVPIKSYSKGMAMERNIKCMIRSGYWAKMIHNIFPSAVWAWSYYRTDLVLGIHQHSMVVAIGKMI